MHEQLEVVEGIAETFSLKLWRVTIYHHLTKREQSERALDRAVNDIFVLPVFPVFQYFSIFLLLVATRGGLSNVVQREFKARETSLVAADT